jgi:hypothetical protein
MSTARLAAAKSPTFVLRHDWAQDTLHRAHQTLHPDDPFLKALQRQTATPVAPDERRRDQGSSLVRRHAPA